MYQFSENPQPSVKTLGLINFSPARCPQNVLECFGLEKADANPLN